MNRVNQRNELVRPGGGGRLIYHVVFIDRFFYLKYRGASANPVPGDVKYKPLSDKKLVLK